MAIDLAGAGATVVVVDREMSIAQPTAEAIEAKGRKALPMAVDVLDAAQVDAMIDQAVKAFGKIDILINNVGGTGRSRRTPITDMEEAVWDLILELNLKSTFLCTRTVARVMKAQQSGRIINIVSSAGLRAYPSLPPYGAAKAALMNFTQSMAVQLAPFNIRVNAIAPGTIATASAAYLGDRDDNARKRGTPLGRAGRVEELTPAAIFLASDASKYITGVTIETTGGPPFAAFFLEEAKGEWAAAEKKERENA
jgi:NAD(P)-dependent dehydrogenase (short-subunit alcohol dehydrogenase family)